MSANNTTVPQTTVALHIGSKFIGINWMVTRIDLDNSKAVPVKKDGTAYVPVQAVVKAFGGTVDETSAVIGDQTMSLENAVEENGALLVPASAFAESFGFFAKYYPDAPYAEDIIVISNEYFYTDDAAAAEAIDPVTIHAVVQLLARVRESRKYVNIEIPQAFYDLADPGQDKGMSEKCIKSLSIANINEALYPIPAEAEKKAGVPEGRLTRLTLENSRVYPGKSHDVWAYVPAQYDGKTPVNLIIFTDGDVFFSSEWKLKFDMPTVLDNMIHEGQIPPTAAVFVAPGKLGDGYPVWGRLNRLDNRSVELDSADERFVNFLFDEVIPAALKDVVIAEEPKKRAIWGVSSGGSAALNACWLRSDKIGTALIACASVAMMRMAGLLPFAIRNQPRKDIQVVLMGGENDINENEWGRWPTVTQMVGDSLEFAEYDHLYLVSKGGHSYEWPARITPAILRDVWMGEKFSFENIVVRSRKGL